MIEPDSIIRKIGWRLLPLLMLLFFFNFLSRVNIGFAALDMNKSLGMPPVVFGWGAGIFFLGYAICQIPSSLLLQRVRVRLWIVSIAVAWGLASAGMAFVTGSKGFIALRLLLGIAEAGFFPGFIYYLSCWFPRDARARFNAVFLVAVPLASTLGNPLSGLILSTGETMGIPAWRWLFILEGLPSIVLGIIAFFWLSDSHAQATWLAPEERRWLADTIAAEHTNTAKLTGDGLLGSVFDVRVALLSIVSFCFIMGIYGVGLWLPQIVSGFGTTPLQTGLLSALPYAASIGGMLFWSARSDAHRERRNHIAAAAVLSGASLIAAAQFQSPTLSLLALSIAAASIFAANAVLWTLPSNFLAGSAAAIGIAIINSIGNLGGFTGPYLVGWVKGQTGDFGPALVSLGAISAVGGLLIVIAPWVFRRLKVSGFE
ncbi:MFS transporter [Afipia sp. DC4300-2b1]|uniref:MFS transporter n=1 Tax=Afipia sp. DC4300-2b1 TaxID=2804672 RepID=UPI003CEC0F46